MPHVIVKLWPGKSEAQKQRLADRITKDVMDAFNYGEESVSVACEEVTSQDWKQKVSKPDIQGRWETLYKKPGYEI
ncbi:MAG: tautomerase family protein [Acetobacteraceae bacterium]|nr:tautomerase family protein [Acetobacteraceae bacterium]